LKEQTELAAIEPSPSMYPSTRGDMPFIMAKRTQSS
jgi:hypothetical protein